MNETMEELNQTILFWFNLREDYTKMRIANENRVRQLTGSNADKDGLIRQYAIDPNKIAAMQYAVEQFSNQADNCTRWIDLTMKKHPLYPWIKKHKGIGAINVASLLATVGDPYWNNLYDRPRTVGELWAYCGLHTDELGRAVRREKENENDKELRAQGLRPKKNNWSTRAKTRAYLVAESAMKTGKAGDVYRDLYDATRARIETKTHYHECKQCKDHSNNCPKVSDFNLKCNCGAVASKPGSNLRDGHKFAYALRIVSKAILKDLYLESKRIHESS